MVFLGCAALNATRTSEGETTAWPGLLVVCSQLSRGAGRKDLVMEIAGWPT